MPYNPTLGGNQPNGSYFNLNPNSLSMSLPNVGTTKNTTSATPYQTQSTGNGLYDFLNSPAGAAAINAGGGLLKGIGDNQMRQQELDQSRGTTTAELLQRQFQNDQQNKIAQAQGMLNADPLGANQQYAQKQALMSAILPNIRNVRSQPGDPGVAAAMGGNRGGIMNAIPQGGFDPKMIEQLYGTDATAGAISRREKELANLDPSVPQNDLTSLFGAAKGTPYEQDVQSFADNLSKLQGDARAQYEQHLMSYANEQAQKEKGSGFWHKFAKIAGIAGAAVATYMTAGAASPLLVAAIGAGAGAASAWGNGASGIGILIGAGLGGATAGFGGGATAAKAGVGAIAQTGAKAATTQIAKNVATNPALYSAILNR